MLDSHGGDVLQELLHRPGTVAAAAREGQQREDSAALGFIAVNLQRGTGAGGRTVQQGAQVLLEEKSQEEEHLPAPSSGGANRCSAPRVQYIHPGSCIRQKLIS